MTSAQHRDGNAAEIADLSVAMCTRNGSRFVAEQVRSILEQSIVPRELVVGDDASTDDTVAIIEATVDAVRSERPAVTTTLRVYRHLTPLGVTANFDATIGACTSAFVALSDHDDVWPAGRTERMLRLFDDPAVTLVHTDAWLVDSTGAPTGILLLDAIEVSPEERRALRSGDAFSVLLRRNLVTGATVVIRRSLAERARPFPSAWVHDEWLASAAAVTGGLRLIDEPWLDYRQHGGNEIGAGRVTWQRRWQKLREPRAERASRLIARATALSERLAEWGATEQQQTDALGKLHFELARAAAPRWQLARVPGVVARWVRGDYARYARGPIDVVRDLVQPPGAR